MIPHEQFIETAAGKIWVGSYGNTTNSAPLLVVHGGPGFLSMPREICDLADERKVIFYDQLGCGRSDRPPDNTYYTLEKYVNELALLREALQLNECHIMAQSWGTLLVAEYILRYQPEGIHSLVLCGPLLSTPRWENDQKHYIEQMPPDAIRTIQHAEQEGCFDSDDYQHVMMTYYHRHICRLDPWPDDLLDALEKMNMDVYTTMWGPSEFTTTGTLKGVDLLPHLSEITQPVLLVCGEYDEAHPRTVYDYREAFTHAHMAVIPMASHTHHLEQPELFRRTVRAYLKAVENSSK